MTKFAIVLIILFKNQVFATCWSIVMLGDLIYEAKGIVVGYRVLNTEDLRVEVTITENGTLKGGIETLRYSNIYSNVLEYPQTRRGILC
jgi:hypothetical protein